ncbi:hypothetical protein [Guptibacillus algicola]|uniref:hypothetical protein n=1 Tax=Guptibacillus algicola TaxID=225844 RepID=UPI001CD663D2|nr:hypothetical protein [Alkalihalobacillus algicola]MCA0987203.1 hypothetical protein [Alkalihalobacillus algicola]
MKRKKLKKIFVQILIVTVTFFVVRGIIEFTPIKGYLGHFTSNAVIQMYHYKDPSIEVDGIELTYDNVQKELANELANEIEAFEELGIAWFGENDLPQLEVIVTKQGKLPHPILLNRNGLYLPKSNVIVINGELSAEERVHALSHEYAHYYLMNSMSQEMAITDLPDWFHEGVAEAFAHRFAPLPFYEAIGNWDVVPYAEMVMKGPGASERYVMAQFTVEKLLEDHGEQVISKIITQTKEQGSFEEGFMEITKQPLSGYHEWLIPDKEFLKEASAKLEEGYNRKQLEKELNVFEQSKGPYFYEAPSIYYILNTIYVEEENWKAASSTMLKRMNYIRHFPGEWKMLSEYASNMGDTDRAIEYAEHAVALTDSSSVDSFEEWLAELRDREE